MTQSISDLKVLAILVAAGPINQMDESAALALSHRGEGTTGWVVKGVAIAKDGDSVTLRLAAAPPPESIV